MIEVQVCLSFIALSQFLLQLGYSVLKQLLLSLGKFCFLFFLWYQHRNLTIESFLDLKQSCFILWITFMQHLFIHVYLLSQGLLNSVSFILQLGQAFFDKAIHSLQLSKFAGSFFGFFESDSLPKDDVICKFAGGVSKFCPGCFSVLVWW